MSQLARFNVMVLLPVLFAFVSTFAHGGVVTFPDFSDTSNLTLSGDAFTTTTVDGTVLRLTPTTSQSGIAFSTEVVDAATLSTYSRFRSTDPGGPLFGGNTEPGPDGLVFVAQAVSNDVGGIGAGIGYAGISPSVDVEFET